MKNRLTYLIFILFGLSICWTVSGQQIIIKTFSFLDKISSNEIKTLYQDKQGFIWIGTSEGVARYDGYDIREFKNTFNTSKPLTGSDILCFAESDEYLWVGTNKGITLIHKETYQARAFPEEHIQGQRIKDMLADDNGDIWVAGNNLYRCNSGLKLEKDYGLHGYPNIIDKDRFGNIWVGTWGQGVFKYNKNKDSFIKYGSCGNNVITKITQDQSGLYWVSTWGSGIYKFNPEKKADQQFEEYPIINPSRSLPETIFFDIVQDDVYGYLWIMSYFKLYVLKKNNENELEEVDINELTGDYNTLETGKTFNRIMKDSEGNLWFGAYDKGIIASFKKEKTENYIIQNLKEDLGMKTNITCINQSHDGIFWFNQSRYGLCLFDDKKNKSSLGFGKGTRYPIEAECIIPSRKHDAMWIGGKNRYATIVFLMDRTDMKVSVREKIDLRNVIKDSGIIVQLTEDASGNLWIATTRHLFIRDAKSKNIILATSELKDIVGLVPGKDETFWIANQKNLCQLRYQNGKVSFETHFSESLPLSQGDNIEKLCADQLGNLWISTSYGSLLEFLTKERSISDRSKDFNLKGDKILHLLSKSNYLWIVYSKKIKLCDLKKKTSIVYSTNDDDIFVSSFHNSSGFLNDYGHLFAGGHNGFIRIPPDLPTTKNNVKNSVFISDIIVDNQSLLFSPSSTKNHNSIQRVILSPDDRNIEITFSSLTYENKQKIKYAYKLEGMDNDWVYVDGGKNTAFYNHLKRGEYTFCVKATDHFGNWTKQECALSIKQLPAFYETWYAFLIYVVLTVLFLYLSIYAYIKRIEKKNEIKLQESLTHIKLNYFTNISHELLTPLTIISCVADDLEENDIKAEKQIDILRSNVSRLKRLLQQILDFRKMDIGRMVLNVDKRNISSFVSGIVAGNFQVLARKKHILLNTEIEDGIWGYMDFDKLDKVIFNLLSNAIKYTPEYKKIYLTLKTIVKDGRRLLVLTVKDEGIGIQAQDLKHIFTRFCNYKNRMGSESNGIGLSLTKELITLHHGTIEVSSEVNKGSVFTVELPIDKEEYKEEEINIPSNSLINDEANTIFEESNTEKLMILFIDDNDDLRALMKNIFRNKYNILTAENGIKGLEILSKNNIDIIICDIMMPLMDGLEFCRIAKQDEHINHIPVILLTAKNATEDQIECYEAGADSYIAKPFEMKLLQTRINNLLESRQKCQQNFREKMEVSISDLDYQSNDKLFLEKAILCVEKHLSETEFDVDKFALDLNMSRSTLSRKLKAITGMPPSDFIRNVRLKHACVMLEDKIVNIAEVADMTGFSSPRYFSKCFKEEFKITPSDYQNKL